MRAAAVRDREHFEIVDRAEPEPAPGEVRVRVTACGVCGTDLHLRALGAYPAGHVPGHEIAGVIDAVGGGVADRVGETVAVEPLRSCGHCRACRAGRDSICREVEVYGMHRPGGFAECIAVPAHRAFAVPRDLDAPLAALVEPMAVAVHGLDRGRLAAGARVLVIGAGTVGLVTVAAARALGAGEVWITARHAHQAKLGAALGATRVLGEDEAQPAALDALGRESEIDLVVETVGGAADTLRAAAAAIRPGGRVSVLGVFHGALSIDPMPLLLKEGTLAWSNCYAHSERGADYETAIRIVAEARSDLRAIVTRVFPLEEIDRAFALASDKRAGSVKVSVAPS